MPRVIAPRSFRPRLLLLPLLFGLLLLPALLRTSTAPAAGELRSGAVCSNFDEIETRPLPEKESNSICAHCRGPMIDVPLANVSSAAADGDATPAA
jgi:hypothetical protein